MRKEGGVMQGIDTSGNWYKGNLHTHTTVSDGKWTPRQVAETYRAGGYSFLAFTDHRIYTQRADLASEDFLILPGIEMDVDQWEPHRIYHMLAIGREDIGGNNGFGQQQAFPGREWRGIGTPQGFLDEAAAANNLTIFCHPNWSRLELGDFIDLDGYFALEIFNYGCALEDHTGLSIDYWDSLLRRGRRIWCVATDDCHHRLNDRGGGWITVNCSALTQKDITAAMEAGNFYASSGPEVFRYELVDGEVHVECSPCAAIHFVTYETFGLSCFPEGDSTITSASFRPREGTKYVRVECVDQRGRTAWTNPIFFD